MKVIYLICLNISLFINSKFSIEPSCNESNCYTDFGECLDDICLCASGYTTIPTNTYVLDFTNQLSKSPNEIHYCNYPFKYKDYAANFEGLMPFGAGHFYAARYLHAFIKFILFWFLSFCKVLFKKRIRLNAFIESSYYICLMLFAALYLTDFLAFTFNYYRDGNGMSLLG